MTIRNIMDLDNFLREVIDYLSDNLKEKVSKKREELAYGLGEIEISAVQNDDGLLIKIHIESGTSFQQINIPFDEVYMINFAKKVWTIINDFLKTELKESFFTFIKNELYVTGKIKDKAISGLHFLRAKTLKNMNIFIKKENEDVNKMNLSISFVDPKGKAQKIEHSFNTSNFFMAISMIVSFIRITIIKYDI